MKLIMDLQKEENMTREEANKALPTLQAFAEGKVIQILDDRSIWTDLAEREGLLIGTLGESPNIFRVKPEPIYRPFKNREECWEEMLKHQPFGWIKCKDNSIPGKFMNITSVRDNEVTINSALNISYSELIKYYTFTDGTPVGVKEEE